MELPNPRRKCQVFATTLWYPELTQAAREKGGGTGATWRPWPPSITTPRQRLRTRMRTTETYQQMVSLSVNFSLMALWSDREVVFWCFIQYFIHILKFKRSIFKLGQFVCLKSTPKVFGQFNFLLSILWAIRSEQWKGAYSQ